MMMNALDPLVHRPDRAAQPDEWGTRRLLKASCERVYQAWTEASLFSHWWGPHAFTNPLCQQDVHVGGRYHVTMRSPDGTDYPLHGTYLKLERPHVLVMTMDCSDHPPAWHDVVRPDRAPEANNPAGIMTLTVILEELSEGGTLLDLRIGFESSAIRNTFVGMGIETGWGESLDSLDALLTAAE